MDTSSPGPDTRSYHPGGGKGLSSLLDSMGGGLSLLLEHAMETPAADPAATALRPSSTALPASIGRFSVLGELGRGGIGVVYRVHDPELGRELALKVLQEPFRGNTEACQRFVEECQIGGQLQHPGIVPIHEMGVLPGPIPYLTMKLVKGKTLAVLLENRRGAREDRQGLLSIFEQVAQTLAYAHSRGVIHRDLKPSNIMVGAFGEVQVMDWGLAKVLGNGGIHDERRARKAHTQASAFSVIRTARQDRDGNLSEAGSILGTPCYMPPEQARGEIHELDERSDVFGLGAILCELLTGRPPYSGSSAAEVRAQAERGDLSAAHRLLDACDADSTLLALARECLHPASRLRPRDAGGVARAMRAYFDSMDRKALDAQEAAAEADVRARGARKARRITAGMVLAILLAIAVGIAGFLHLEHAQSGRTEAAVAAVERARGEVEARAAEAQNSGARDASRWTLALEAARVVEEQARHSGDASLAIAATQRRQEIERLHDSAVAEADRLRREQEGAERLVLLRLRQGHLRRGEEQGLASGYADVFGQLGITPREPDAGNRLAATSIAPALARALDEWAALLRTSPDTERGDWEPLQRAALGADADVVARELRQALLAGEPQRLTACARAIVAEPILPGNVLEILRDQAREPSAGEDKLAAIPAPARASAAALDLLLAALVEHRQLDLARELGRKAHIYYPGDFWLHHRLALLLQGEESRDEALGHYAAANALRPDLAHTWTDLGRLRAMAEKWDEALPAFRRALDLPGVESAVREELAQSWRNRLDFSAAAAAYRQLLDSNPARADLQRLLGETLLTGAGFLRGDEAASNLEGSLAAFRRALVLEPGSALALSGLTASLARAGNVLEAASTARQLVEASGDAASAHLQLGKALLDAERNVEAAAALEAAVARAGSSAETHLLLALARGRQGDEQAFVAALGSALDLAPPVEPILARELAELPPPILERQQQSEGRLAAPRWREAERYLGALVAQGKGGTLAWTYLGLVRLRLRDVAASLQCFEKALGAHADDFLAHAGMALIRQIEARRQLDRRSALLEEALQWLDRAELVAPDTPRLWAQRAVLLDDLGRQPESLRHLQNAVDAEASQVETRLNLARALWKVPRLADAVSVVNAVLAVEPDSPAAHGLLGQLAREQAREEIALKHGRRALELDPGSAAAWDFVGLLAFESGRLEESRLAAQKAIALEPEHPLFQVHLATTVEQLGNWDEAATLKQAASLLPGCPRAVFADLLRLHRRLRQPCAGVDALRRWIELDSRQGQSIAALDLNHVRDFLELGESLLPCEELPMLMSSLEQALLLPDADLSRARVFLDLWLLRPVASALDAVALAQRLVADSGGSEPGALETLARVLHKSGQGAAAVATLEGLARLTPLLLHNRERLVAWREELLPSLPTFASVDALLDRGDVLLGKGARMRYFKGFRAPPGGFAWVESSYDDSGWAETEQPCGYSVGSIADPMEDLQGRNASLYLRTTFKIPSRRQLHGVSLVFRAFDGVVIWVNGEEAGRRFAGPPGSQLAHDAQASERDSEMFQWETLEVPRELLRDGDNTLAFHLLDRPSANAGLYLEVEVRGLRSPELERQRLDAFRVVANDPAAKARASYLEGRILEREGKPREAVAAFERALPEAGEATPPFHRLLDNLRSIEGREAGEAAFHARVASLKLPAELVAARPAPNGPLRPDDGSIVPGAAVALEAPPYFSFAPQGTHTASLWEIWPEVDEFTRLPLHRLSSDVALSRLDIPPGLLTPATSYRWRVAYAGPGGTLSGFSREARFKTPELPLGIHRFDLSPYFDRDVIANPGDEQDDSWDHVGLAWTVDGFDGVSQDQTAWRGLPGDGRVGLHQLASFQDPNCLQLTRGNLRAVHLPVPPGGLQCLRLLVGGGGGSVELSLRLEFTAGSPVQTRLHCPDWTRTSWNFQPRNTLVSCLLEGLDAVWVQGPNRRHPPGRREAGRQFFELVVPLPPDRELTAIVLAPQPADFQDDTAHLNLLSIVGVSTHD